MKLDTITDSNTKLLIVDDDPTVTTFFKLILAQFNYSISTKHSGQECIDLIKKDNTFNLILLDIVMPGISGLETLKQIIQINPHLKVILISSRPFRKLFKNTYALGAHGILFKPFEPEEALDIIHKAIEQ